MNPTNIIERVQFARDVINQWRDRVNFHSKIDSNSAGIKPLTHGFIGLLDYIKTGKLELINDDQLRIIFENQVFGTSPQ